MRTFALWLFNKFYSIDIVVNNDKYIDIPIHSNQFFMSPMNKLALYLRERR